MSPSFRASLRSFLLGPVSSVAMISIVALGGCDGETREPLDPGSPEDEVAATCEGCHTSESNLKATALPDPPPSEDPGEG